MQRPRPSMLPGSRATLVLAAAAVLFWLAYDGGTYSIASRTTLAIVTWWAILLGVAARIWPREPFSRLGAAACGLLAALAGLTLVSAAWAPSAEQVVLEFDRVSLYLGICALPLLALRRRHLPAVADGAALAIAAVVLLALTSRLFPGSLPSGNVPKFLASASTRLSYPLDYWNGLGILAGMGVPLLLRTAVAGRTAILRGLAVAPLPAFGAAIFLTSSRGAIVVACVAVAAFLVLTDGRLRALAALSVSSSAALVAVQAIRHRPHLVDGPFADQIAHHQGREAAWRVVALCAVAGALYGFASRFLPWRFPGRPLVGRVFAAGLIVAAVVGLVAVHPVRIFERFKQPATVAQKTANVSSVEGHLSSDTGSGRWQIWTAAVHEFESRPLLGRGAGSFEPWWAKNGTLVAHVQDAHSQYLQTLGELGLFGFLLLAGFVAVSLAGIARAVRVTTGPLRVQVAGAGALVLAFLVALGIDWMWQLTAVGAIGVLFASLLANGIESDDELVRVSRLHRGHLRYVVPIGVALLSALLIASQVVPLLAQSNLVKSQSAAERGDLTAALDAALSARRIEPWAASPYLQLALVAESAGDVGPARAWLAKAIARDRSNWTLWVTQARLETEAGAIDAARRSLHTAARLNPHSLLFTALGVSP
jgi:hypothetical protein